MSDKRSENQDEKKEVDGESGSAWTINMDLVWVLLNGHMGVVRN